MTDTALIFILKFFITVLLRTKTFSTIEQKVVDWSTKALAGKEKRAGVMGEIQTMLPNVTETVVRLGVEMAVIKLQGYRLNVPPTIEEALVDNNPK
jgi:hypothetical protein